MLKKLLSTLISLIIVMGLIVLPVSAAVNSPSEVYVVSRHDRNIIVIKSKTETAFNIYSKASDGTLTKLTLEQAPDTNAKTGEGSNYASWTNRGIYPYIQTGLTQGTTYTYVVKSVDAQGNESEGVEASGTPAANKASFQTQTINSHWVYQNNSNAFSTADVRTGVGVDDSAALYITKIGLDNNNSSYQDIFFNSNYVTEADQVYKLTWKQKLGDNLFGLGAGITSNNSNSSVDGIKFAANTAYPYDQTVDVIGQWVEKTMYYKGTGNKFSFSARINRFAETMIWDEFKLVKVNSELQEVDGVNLIASDDADFEAAFVPPTKPEDAYVVPRSGQNIIIIESSDSTNFNIYLKKNDGTLQKLDLPAGRGVDGNTGSNANRWLEFNRYPFEHANLTNDTTYTYVVKAVGSNGVESEGIEISGTPAANKGTGQNQTINKYWKFQNNSVSYGTAVVKDGIGTDGSAALHITKLGIHSQNSTYMDFFYETGYVTEADQIYKLTWNQKLGSQRNETFYGWGFPLFRSHGSNDGVTFYGADKVEHPYNASVDIVDTWVPKALYFKGDGNAFTFTARLHQFVKYAIWDDFKLVKVDSSLNEVDGVNLIASADADFEEAFTPPADPDKVYVVERNGFNVIVVESTKNNKFNIYEKGSNSELTKLTLTSATDASGTVGAADATWAKEGVYAFEHTGLDNSSEYTYVVKSLNDSGLESTGVEVKGTPNSLAGSELRINDNWVYTSAGRSYGTVEIKKGVGVNGTVGMYMTNLGRFDQNSSYSDYYYRPNITTEENQLYKLTWMQKIGTAANETYQGYGYKFISGNGSVDGTTFYGIGELAHPYDKNVDIVGEWVEKTLYFKGDGNEFLLNIRLHMFLKYIIWDNFKLVKVDSDLKEIDGVNLIADSDCDFEKNYKTQLTASLAFYPAADTTAGYEEEDYGSIIGDPIYAFSDLEDYGSRTLRAEVEVKNVGFSQGAPVAVILAIYKDNALFIADTLTATVSELENAMQDGEIYSLVYTLPETLDDAVYSAKLMVWNGFATMKPVEDALEIFEN